MKRNGGCVPEVGGDRPGPSRYQEDVAREIGVFHRTRWGIAVVNGNGATEAKRSHITVPVGAREEELPTGRRARAERRPVSRGHSARPTALCARMRFAGQYASDLRRASISHRVPCSEQYRLPIRSFIKYRRPNRQGPGKADKSVRRRRCSVTTKRYTILYYTILYSTLLYSTLLYTVCVGRACSELVPGGGVWLWYARSRRACQLCAVVVVRCGGYAWRWLCAGQRF